MKAYCGVASQAASCAAAGPRQALPEGGLGDRRRPRACPTTFRGAVLVVRLPVLLAAVAGLLVAQTAIETTRVAARPLSRTVLLNGEFLPYESVDLHARVSGFVEKVLVDRGSQVRAGDLLVTLAAPEMDAQIAEARGKVAVAWSRSCSGGPT